VSGIEKRALATTLHDLVEEDVDGAVIERRRDGDDVQVDTS
jgi:hypothetical protein